MFVIYGIKSKTSSKIYVGASGNFKRRWTEHKNALKNNKHHSIKLQRAWNKYGKEDFEFFVLEKGDGNSVRREQHWIDKLDAYENGYNSYRYAGSLPIGKKNGMYGKSSPNRGKPCKNRKSLIAYEIKTGKLEHFEYSQIAFKLYGSCIYENLKNKTKSAKNRFWFYSDDLNLKNLRKKFIKLKAPDGNLGQKRSKEARRAISEARKGMKFSEEHIKNMIKVRIGKGTKKIVRSDGKIYNSIKEASEEIGLKNPTSLSHHLNGRGKSCKGWTFKYKI